MDTKEFMGTYFPAVNSLIVTFATVLLAWLTSKYVKLTKHMVDAMKETREPSVYVDFELPDNMLRLIVGNSGQTPAVNITFDVTADLPWLQFFNDRSGISAIKAIHSGISYLAPGRILKFDAGNFEGDMTKENRTLKIVLSFENETGKQFKKDIVIDMIQYEDVLFESFKDSSITIAEAIKDAERHRDLNSRFNSFLNPRR